MRTLTKAASYWEVHRLSRMKAFAVGCAAVLLLQAGVVAVIDTTSCTEACRGRWSREGYEAAWCYWGDEIHFSVSDNSTGWVGIGFSRNRRMPQSDVVMGGTGANSTTFIYDMYAEERARPPVDEEQNLQNTSVKIVDGRVTVSFIRKLVTGDDRDLDLDQCRQFLYAWGGRVGNNPPLTLGRHRMRFAPRAEVCPPTPGTCPPQCPIKGQEYYDGVNTCVPCTGTCANRNPVCTLECRSGCGCPVGTVLDEEANACVNETDCPKRDCLEGDVIYKDGDRWNCSDGCNTCFCSDGRVGSTEIACDPCVARPVTGPCRAYIPRYFYNTTSLKCEMFIYGGCRGNRNNFETLRECTKECAVRLGGVCSLSADPGPCCNDSLTQRFFYNSTSMKCERFIYGGCPGNANNFESEEECNGCCGCPYEGMRYYDVSEGECAPCFGTCEEPNVPCPRICRSGCACPPGTVLHEGECINVTECSKECSVEGQEYYDGVNTCVPCTGTCKEPIIACTLECRSGCGCPVGTVLDEEANACVNETDCPKRDCLEGDVIYKDGDMWNCSDGCNTCFCSNGVVGSTLKLCDPCMARPVTGPCLAYIPRYFYNTTSLKCEMFIYGGCQGNRNNFETLTECTKECALRLDGVCSLGADPGPCRASIPRFFYNSTSMKCERFIYGGCPGNDNNFGSEEECQGCCGCPYEGMRYYDISRDECAPCFGTCEEPNVPCPLVCRSGCACPPGTVLHEEECINVTECSKADCREGDQTYKHGDSWLCSDGCNTCFCSDGVVGSTLKLCDPCVARPVTGPCRAAFPRYFYNTTSLKCEMFIYGGCQGNRNNFETLTECTKECALRLDGVCSLSPDPGPCLASIPRFFYNSTSMKCERFVYGGCAGNANNYESKEDCVECCGCPYKGMKYYSEGECAPCFGTCEEPNVPCPLVCGPGCACPPGTVLHKGECIPAEECPKECPVEGQVYYDGVITCAPNTGTCEEPEVACPAICRSGCACPPGTVLHEGECIPTEECLIECEVEGQEYYDGVNTCVPCTGTCEEPEVACTLECRSGCGCPVGTVLDEEANACVNETDCPPECEVEGQEYYDGVNACVPCTGTCEEPDKVCIALCTSGCGCPVGTVLDEEANACVNETDCPPACPEECSHRFCRQNGPNTMCSVPGSTGPGCTGRCHITQCRACYYSRPVQACPDCSYKCGEDPSGACFREWSRCVRGGIESGRARANRFKCVDPCECPKAE